MCKSRRTPTSVYERTLVQKAPVSWFPRLRFCWRYKNLEFRNTIRLGIDYIYTCLRRSSTSFKVTHGPSVSSQRSEPHFRSSFSLSISCSALQVEQIALEVTLEKER